MLPALKYLHQVKQVNEHVSLVTVFLQWAHPPLTWTTTVIIQTRFLKKKPLAFQKSAEERRPSSFMHFYSLFFHCCYVWCMVKNILKSGRLEITTEPLCPVLPAGCASVSAFDSMPCPVLPDVLKLDRHCNQQCKTFSPLPVQPMTDLMLCTCFSWSFWLHNSAVVTVRSESESYFFFPLFCSMRSFSAHSQPIHVLYL